MRISAGVDDKGRQLQDNIVRRIDVSAILRDVPQLVNAVYNVEVEGHSVRLTPLQLAVHLGNEKAVEALLQARAPPDDCGSTVTVEGYIAGESGVADW